MDKFEGTDEGILKLFRDWLAAFEAIQTRYEMASKADETLRQIEIKLAAMPARELSGLVIKHGLQHFLAEHANANQALSESLYRDLVCLTGLDPIREITTDRKSVV